MLIRSAVILVIIFFLPVDTGAMILVEDTVRKGEIEVWEDIVVPKGGDAYRPGRVPDQDLAGRVYQG